MLRFEYQNESNKFSEEELKTYLEEHEWVLKAARTQNNRYEDNLGWLDPGKWGGEDAIRKIEEAAETVRRQADVFVLVGIGGSNNGARAVMKALEKEGMPKVYYAGNTISPHSVHLLLEELEGKSVYINVIAKNFETLEPGIGFRVLRKFLEDRYGTEAGKRIFVTGTPGSYLDKLCKEQGYSFFTFPKDIGGRYSVLCDVGLLPVAVAGMDIRKMLQGAEDMRKALVNNCGLDNAAFCYAALRNMLYDRGYRMEMLFFFEPRLRYFAKWWIQLFAESEGKEGKGIYPVSAQCSEDLHSIGQFVQEGSPVIFETFLDVVEQDASYVLEQDGVDDRFGYLNGMDLWEINKAAYQATYKAHAERNPVLSLTVERLDEYHFGQLFYFFEFACYLSGMLLGINPFNQPGVEAYKKYMFEALHKPA